MSPLKIEFATVRELEKKTFRVFGYGGAAFAFGLILTLIGLGIVGAPVMLISAAVVVLAVVWVSMLGKEPSRPTFCPYCASRNDVFQSRRSFNCDICNRPVIVNELGEAVAAAHEHVETPTRNAHN
jgi:hypothetical protein